jgi:hypothetical protein
MSTEESIKTAITGLGLFQETELGKALRKVLPPRLTRVIIDIPVGEVAKIYYASIDSGPIVDLKWDQIIEQFEVVSPQKNAKKLTTESTEDTEKISHE